MSLSVGYEPVAVPDIEALLEEALNESRFDFVVSPLAHSRNERQYPGSELYDSAEIQHNEEAVPFTRSDMLLSSAQWSSFVVGASSAWIDTDHRCADRARNSSLALQQELRWAGHLSLPAVLLPPPRPNATNLARILHQTAMGLSYGQLWVRLPVSMRAGDRDSWHWWNTLRTLCEYHSHLHPVLELGADLPEEIVLRRWLAEPIKAAILPTSIFLTNRAGFPTLSRPHQNFMRQLFRLKIQVVIRGANLASKGMAAYVDYMRHLFATQPELSEKDQFESPYYDYLQTPLQPLMDNLESQTYETFERDPVKYDLYEQAVAEALRDRAGQPTVLMVVGAGRGPLVRASLRAGASTGYSDPSMLRIYAVEKNPNAVVTLLNMKRALGWGNQVTIVDHDMRTWQAPELADILVSELLGSFGDNELSPECLDGAQKFLKPGGVSIPTSYTSFIAPIMAHKVWADVKNYDDLKHFETPYVVKLFNSMELADPQSVFTFVHPNTDKVIDNTRYISLEFESRHTATIHGFVGYFDSVLYKDIHCSILPSTYSGEMFSWFPIYFPIRTPYLVNEGQKIHVQFWRCNGKGKVWYQWCTTAPTVTALHNPNGRSSWIGL